MARRANRKTRKDALGLVFLLLAAGVVLVLLGFAASARFSRPAVDPKTLCLSSGPESVTIIVVDATDRLDPLQREHVRILLDDLKKDVPRNGEIQLYSIGTSAQDLLRPELNICNPGTGADANPIFANRRHLQRQWQTKFSNRVDRVLSGLLSVQPSQTSPIMESIQAVALEGFAGDRLKNVPKRLFIVSDMLQHTTGFSQYSGQTTFDHFKRSEYYLKVRPTLKDVEVELYYIRRTDGFRGQGRMHIEFWEQFFADAGATLTHVVSIEG